MVEVTLGHPKQTFLHKQPQAAVANAAGSVSGPLQAYTVSRSGRDGGCDAGRHDNMHDNNS